MYTLRLSSKDCISCGICMDVCAAHAIAMRSKYPRTPEGSRLTYLQLDSVGNREVAMAVMATFPFLATPALCDGCERCIAECPTMALELRAVPPN